MKTKAILTVFALAAAASMQLLVPHPAAAQSEPQAASNMGCWRGAPRPACGGFFLVEAQGVFPFLGTTRVQSYPGGPDFHVESFESRLEWNLGYMVNVSPRWAVGGALSLGTGSYDALTGLRARARRWVGPQLSLELQGGLVLTHAHNYGGGILRGLTTDARINIGDRGSFFVRWDGVNVPLQRTPTGEVWDTGGFQQALHVGVGTGSTWTAVGTGALALWYTVLLLQFKPS